MSALAWGVVIGAGLIGAFGGFGVCALVCASTRAKRALAAREAQAQAEAQAERYRLLERWMREEWDKARCELAKANARTFEDAGLGVWHGDVGGRL